MTPSPPPPGGSESIHAEEQSWEPCFRDGATNKDEPIVVKEDSQFLPVFQAGLQCKASPYKAQSWISLALTLDGRDKITKVLQYATRLLAFLCETKVNQMRWSSLSSSLSNSRKPFRLGKTFIEVDKLNKMGIWALVLHLVGLKKEYSSKDPAWKTIGMALKTLGLAGFWAADNANFLISSGALDDSRLEPKERMQQNKRRKYQCMLVAYRSYFAGSVAGLFTNLRIYWIHKTVNLALALQQYQSASTDEERSRAQLALTRTREENFGLLVALVKSCVDVMVFANNLDLFRRFFGRKLHEGVHCAGGLISAATVLYNNYPSASK